MALGASMAPVEFGKAIASGDPKAIGRAAFDLELALAGGKTLKPKVTNPYKALRGGTTKAMAKTKAVVSNTTKVAMFGGGRAVASCSARGSLPNTVTSKQCCMGDTSLGNRRLVHP